MGLAVLNTMVSSVDFVGLLRLYWLCGCLWFRGCLVVTGWCGLLVSLVRIVRVFLWLCGGFMFVFVLSVLQFRYL